MALYRRIFMTSTYNGTISNKNGNINDDIETKGLIKRMALIYDSIVDIVDTLNFCFSIQVICNMVTGRCVYV